jgi:anti-sigma regulatory factor (Ser/Thr protein kinase)
VVEDICFHIVDMVENAVAAGADTIDVLIFESEKENLLRLEVRDNGRGMDRETVQKAMDPFYTTKEFKKVGLGIPLLKATAQACHGDLQIASRPGEGTKIRAWMEKNHVDCPPLGPISETVLGLLVSFDQRNLRFTFESGRGLFSLSTADIRRQVGDLHFSHPDVFRFLKDYLNEKLEPLTGAPG